MDSFTHPEATLAVQFRRCLLRWYDQHRRELPWRETRNPYRVWLSEIMLQQTRVASVIAHYHEFLRRFPTVKRLAVAREASVLAAWSGLGYYQRARRLHATAKAVMRNYGGKLPATSAQLRALPGIGRYTAAAIASIAFGEAVPTVDSNVERVLERITGHPLPGEKSWERAGALLEKSRPGDFNQAMMELGATVCGPRSPACLACPVIKLCATRGELAKPSKATAQKRREIHYALSCRDRGRRQARVFLVQRPHNASLMASMWELPEIQQPAPQATSAFTLRHSITVTNYMVRIWDQPAPHQVIGRWFQVSRLRTLPLTGLARKILRKAGVWAALSGDGADRREPSTA
jgi:A/G-specific adenine glycosylase